MSDPNITSEPITDIVVAAHLRTVRSFVRREGRLTRAQQQALDHYWVKHGVEYRPQHLDIEQLFQRRAPLIVDVGVGTGETTLHLAASHPENNYLAIEVHRPGIGQLLNQIEHQRLHNIKIINADVMDIFSYQLPRHCCNQILLFFPDPWPKKRHQKRRLLNARLLILLKAVMQQQGRFYIATDWMDYAEQIQFLFNADPDFINLAGANGIACRPEWRVDTRYERRGLRLGHKIWDFCYGLS